MKSFILDKLLSHWESWIGPVIAGAVLGAIIAQGA
jgi:hypothetical protein